MKETIHIYHFEVFYQYLDLFGHINNAAYLKIFEEARWDLIHSNGYGIDKIIAEQKGPTILDIHINFKNELKAKEKAYIQTYRTETRGKIMELEQEMFNSKKELCSAAKFKFGFFDLKARKLITPSEDWLQAIQPSKKNN